MREDVVIFVNVAADHDVLRRRHPEEHLKVLERARHAAQRQLVRGEVGHVCAFEDDTASLRDIDAADHVEQGRLAGAVWPDQREDFAAIDGEANAVDGDDAAESNPQIFDAEDGHAGLRRISAAMAGTMPLGSRIRNTTMMAPRTTCSYS